MSTSLCTQVMMSYPTIYGRVEHSLNIYSVGACIYHQLCWTIGSFKKGSPLEFGDLNERNVLSKVLSESFSCQYVVHICFKRLDKFSYKSFECKNHKWFKISGSKFKSDVFSLSLCGIGYTWLGWVDALFSVIFRVVWTVWKVDLMLEYLFAGIITVFLVGEGVSLSTLSLLPLSKKTLGKISLCNTFLGAHEWKEKNSRGTFFFNLPRWLHRGQYIFRSQVHKCDLSKSIVYFNELFIGSNKLCNQRLLTSNIQHTSKYTKMNVISDSFWTLLMHCATVFSSCGHESLCETIYGLLLHFGSIALQKKSLRLCIFSLFEIWVGISLCSTPEGLFRHQNYRSQKTYRIILRNLSCPYFGSLFKLPLAMLNRFIKEGEYVSRRNWTFN